MADEVSTALDFARYDGEVVYCMRVDEYPVAVMRSGPVLFLPDTAEAQHPEGVARIAIVDAEPLIIDLDEASDSPELDAWAHQVRSAASVADIRGQIADALAG